MERNSAYLLQTDVNQLAINPIKYAEKIKACCEAIRKNPFDINSIAAQNEIYKALDEAEIIQLNKDDPMNVVINKFITKLLYIFYRHGEESKSYKEIKVFIDVLNPELKNYSVEELKNYIREQEEHNNNYFSCYLSDDSDSEDYMDDSADDVDSTHSLPISISKLEQFKEFLAKNLNKLLTLDRDLELKDITCLPSFKERQSLNYEGKNFEKAKLQLEILNNQLKAGKSINQILPKLETRFYVAQYRGVTYFLDKWNQTTRKNHREIDETFEYYYSEAVYHAAGYVPMNQFFKIKEQPLKVQQKLYSKASIIRGKMISLQTTKDPANYKNKTYANFKILLQETYTNSYTEFKELITGNKYLKKILSNGGNPFVSTAGTPYHALRYAYGMKAYPRQKEFRLQPRWNKEGRAERPYVGKCHAFLIPLNDFNLIENPSHLVSQNWQGELSIPNHIIAERETSFDAFIDKDKIFLQHIAKYPSFNKPYKLSFMVKYGLDEPLYLLFQKAIKQTKPHTQGRKNLKLLIGEWLCYVFEIKLIKEAQAAANNRGGYVVYQDKEKNQFTFELPIDTPMRNNREVTAEQRQAVKDKRQRNIIDNYFPRPSYGLNNNNIRENADYRSGMSRMIEELSIETDYPSPYPQNNSTIESSQPKESNNNQQITVSNVNNQNTQSVAQHNLIQTIITNHSSNNFSNNTKDDFNSSEKQLNKNTVNIQPIIIDDDDDETYEFSVQTCQEEAMKGNAAAQFELGKRYEYGHGLSKDEKKACFCYWKAAEQRHISVIEYIQKKATSGIAWAEYLYGYLHEYGYGVPQLEERAFYWIKRAAEQKYPIALYALASSYVVGNQLNKNELEAVNLCWQAAEKGESQALQLLEKKAKYQLALCYEHGYKVPKDEKNAVRHCKDLAEQGYTPAIEWLHKKAEQDKNVHAQYWLGWLYSNGRGVPYDANKAFNLLESAAKQNYVYAQHSVAKCYQHGRGAPKNLQLAIEWYQRAIANGDETDREELEKITQAQINHPSFRI